MQFSNFLQNFFLSLYFLYILEKRNRVSASQPFPSLLFILEKNWGHEVYVIKIVSNSLMYSKIALERRLGLKAMKIQGWTKLDGLFTPVRAMKRLLRLVTKGALRHVQKHSRRETPDASWQIKELK